MEILLYSLGLFLFGTMLGSYLNSWMWRVHTNRWRFGGKSMCIHCSRQLKWYENIPLCSFLYLRGKCATCRGKIPADYFLVELTCGVIFAALGWYYSSLDLNVERNFILFTRDFIFLMLLLITFVYDYKYQFILSGVMWAGMVIGFVLNYFYLHIPLQSLLLGLGVGGGFFLLQYVISRGRWIGGGDMYLGAMIGVLLGWPNIIVALFVSYILGALVAVPLLITKRKTGESKIPFGTFLTIGTVVAMYFGERILNWYTGIVGW